MEAYSNYAGGYMSKQTRTAIAQDLRKSHFHLGGNAVDYNSAYKSQFNQGIGGAQPMPEEMLANIRKSHWTMGSNNTSMNVETEAQQHYKQRGGSASTLDKKTKADLRSTHFSLGNGKQKKMKSQSKRDFKKKKPKKGSQAAAEALGQQIKKSNFHFSEKGVQGQSIAKSDFIGKSVKQEVDYEARKQLRMAHFSFGDERPSFATQSAANFNTKPIEPASLNKAQLNDLRSEHFQIGTGASNYATSSSTNHNWKKTPEKQEGTRQKAVALRETHFSMGADANNYQTAVNQSFTKYPAQPAQDHTAMVKRIRGSSIEFGTSQVKNYSTESASRFEGRKGQSAALDQGKLKDLRAHHFGLGNDAATTQSQAKDDFKPRPQSANPTSNAAVADRIKKHSFVYGTANFTPVTSNKQDFRPVTAQKVEEVQAKADLRKDHFAFGTAARSYQTESQNQFIDRGSAQVSGQKNMTQVSNIPKAYGEMPKTSMYASNFTWKQPSMEKEYR